MIIEADFVKDWENELRVRLIGMGYNVGDGASFDEISMTFFDVAHRLLELGPRKVHLATGLQCPEKVREGFDALIRKIEAGDNLSAHLSKSVGRPDAYDALLNEWAIRHLHLGTTIGSDGYINRTGLLLHGIFNRQDAYLIGIYDHGQWTNIELLEVAHCEWPFLFERSELQGTTAPQLTPEQRKNLRRNNVGFTVSLNGKTYGPPGGGSTASGIGISVVRRSDYYLLCVRDCERRLKESAHEIETKALAHGVTLPDPSRFTLRVTQQGDAVAFTATGTTRFEANLGPLYIPWDASDH